jgi:hypothetical protein
MDNMKSNSDIVKSDEFKKMLAITYLVLSLPYTGNHNKFKK